VAQLTAGKARAGFRLLVVGREEGWRAARTQCNFTAQGKAADVVSRCHNGVDCLAGAGVAECGITINININTAYYTPAGFTYTRHLPIGLAEAQSKGYGASRAG
jgi:hypothetical protein